MTSDKDRAIQGKRERQKTMDKLSVKSGQAYTYDTSEDNDATKSGCLKNAEKAGEKR